MRALTAVFCLLVAGTARAQDFTGTWDVTGTDPALGAYSGEVAVDKTTTGFTFRRLVSVAKKLPDGRTLALAWEGTARSEAGGLRVDTALRRAEFVAELGALKRGPTDQVPLALTALLKAPGGAAITTVAPGTSVTGKFFAGTTAGADETWVRVARPPAAIPRVEKHKEAYVTGAALKAIYFALFQSFWKLPTVAPYASRPEFQAGVVYQVVETTGKSYARAHPDHLLVVQKVVDDIALLEEDLRARAFRTKLVDKASGWDAAMAKDHLEKLTGMIGGYVPATGARVVHGDNCLHQGSWVGSQAWRYLATGDAAAIANVQDGLRALVAICDAPGNPSEFARAVQDANTAPASWTRSTALPGIAYIPGGNNDMLHGVDYGFVMAEKVLPAGHPALAEIGARAKRLVENNKEAKGGKHFIVLSGLAARLTGDAAVKKAYNKKMRWSPLEMLWTATGEGIPTLPQFNGGSGNHLSTHGFIKLRELGGSKPDFFEKLWRKVADTGLKAAFNGKKLYRPGLLAAVASSAGIPGAGDLARDVLAEMPYPSIVGTARIDHSVDGAFCVSPYPAFFYKFDFLKPTEDRRQSLDSFPLWHVGDSDNYWKDGPFQPWQGSQNTVQWARQDYLHAYWVARAAGTIAAGD